MGELRGAMMKSSKVWKVTHKFLFYRSSSVERKKDKKKKSKKHKKEK